MKIKRAGQHVKAFVVSDNVFGDVSVTLTPSGIEKYIGTKKFTFLHRYIYNIPIELCYPDDIPSGSMYCIYGDEKVKGSAIIFGYDDDIRSLTPFEIDVIRSCSNMMKLDGVNQLLVGKITKEPSGCPLEIAIE